MVLALRSSILFERMYRSNLLTGQRALQYIACFSTNSSSQGMGRRVLVITGGTSHLAKEIRITAFRRGYDVVSCTRRTFQNTEYGNWEKFDEKHLTSIPHWEGLFKKISIEAQKVVLVNTIGTAFAPKGTSLEIINEKPVLAAVEAFKTIKVKKVIGQISSIAPVYFSDDELLQKQFDPQAIEYCLGRRRVDLILESCGIPTTILRPGYVFNSTHEGTQIDSGHDYSPEQFTALLLHPIVGSGRQLHQPVFSGDLIDALMNGIETEDTQVVNAVGSEAMTQEEMIKIFVELAGKPFRPLYIPTEVAAIVARHFPKGRLAPYAISILKHLENHNKTPLPHEPFEKLVGRSLSSIDDIYRKQGGKAYFFPRSPIYKHIKEIIVGISVNKEAREDFIRMTIKYGPALILAALKKIAIRVK